jgi:ATP-binding cassette subfamily F protein 3
VRVAELVAAEAWIGDRPLWRGVNLAVEQGDRLALVGRNGVGKSTLLAALAGDRRLEAGRAHLHPGVRVARLRQEIDPAGPEGARTAWQLLEEADPAARAEREMQRRAEWLAAHPADAAAAAAWAEAERAYRHAGGEAWRAAAARLLSDLGVDDRLTSRPIAALSGGERARVALAAALTRRADLLLLDEPTNHLDLVAIEHLTERLKRQPGSLVLVAHDRHLLEAVATAVAEVSPAGVTVYRMGYASYRRERQRREDLDQRRRDALAAEAVTLRRFVDTWRSGTRHAQAQSRLGRLARLEEERRSLERPAGPAVPRMTATAPTSGSGSERAPGPLLSLAGAAVALPDGRPLLADVTLEVRPHDRLALVGKNGAGKTSLLQVLVGRRDPAAGLRRTRPFARFALLDQEEADRLVGAGGAQPLFDRLQRVSGWGAEAVHALLGRFGFPPDQRTAPVGRLSGGERQRLALALALSSGADALLLDEPTNHLDLEAREALAAAIRGFAGAVVVVSHDRSLLEAVAGRFAVVREGRVEVLPEGSDLARALAAFRPAPPPPTGAAGGPSPAARPTPAASARQAPDRQARARAREREAALWREVEALSERRQALVDDLARLRGPAAAQAARDLAQVAEALDAAEAAWGRAAELAEAMRSEAGDA